MEVRLKKILWKYDPHLNGRCTIKFQVWCKLPKIAQVWLGSQDDARARLRRIPVVAEPVKQGRLLFLLPLLSPPPFRLLGT